MTFHVVRRSSNFFDEQCPMLIEVNFGGLERETTDHPTPRLLRIQPNTTQLGHHTKIHLGQQYFCVILCVQVENIREGKALF